MKTDFVSKAPNPLGLSPCVQLLAAPPAMVEFIGHTQVHAFPIAGLNHLVLKPNPEFRGDRRVAPDTLIVEYPTARMTLVGWRLDRLAQLFRMGRVARVRVVPEPRYKSGLKEAHVTGMWINEFKQN